MFLVDPSGRRKDKVMVSVVDCDSPEDDEQAQPSGSNIPPPVPDITKSTPLKQQQAIVKFVANNYQVQNM